MISYAKKQLIHIAKQQIGMTDPEYRDFLAGFGVSSCVELDDETFDAVMDAFYGLGFESKVKVGQRTVTVPGNKSKLWWKLQSLLRQTGS